MELCTNECHIQFLYRIISEELFAIPPFLLIHISIKLMAVIRLDVATKYQLVENESITDHLTYQIIYLQFI